MNNPRYLLGLHLVHISKLSSNEKKRVLSIILIVIKVSKKNFVAQPNVIGFVTSINFACYRARHSVVTTVDGVFAVEGDCLVNYEFI